MNVLAFDIETIPDIQGGRRLYDLSDDLSDDDVTKIRRFIAIPLVMNLMCGH